MDEVQGCVDGLGLWAYLRKKLRWDSEGSFLSQSPLKNFSHDEVSHGSFMGLETCQQILGNLAVRSGLSSSSCHRLCLPGS